jgi:hypothetical protein
LKPAWHKALRVSFCPKNRHFGLNRKIQVFVDGCTIGALRSYMSIISSDL